MADYYDLNRPYSLENWNDLVRAVNEVLQNPPEDTDCKPVAPVPEATDPHLWSTDDVSAVRDALTQTCPSITFSAPLTRWTAEILDEIVTAMDQAWCDCKPEEPDQDCLQPCSNAQGTQVRYLGSFMAVGCTENISTTDCVSAYRSPIEQAGREADRLSDLWAATWAQYCSLTASCKVLEKELAKLQDELSQLLQQQAVACGPNGTPTTCAQAQERVTAKQAEVKQKQDELAQKTQERDTKQQEADKYKGDADAAAGVCLDIAGGATSGGTAINIVYLIAGTREPWADTACEGLGPSWAGCDPRRCRTDWSLSRRTTYYWSFGMIQHFSWVPVISGRYTPSGTPYITSVSMCPECPRYACGSTDCSVGDCNSEQEYEFRLTLSYPMPSDPICRDTGGESGEELPG